LSLPWPRMLPRSPPVKPGPRPPRRPSSSPSSGSHGFSASPGSWRFAPPAATAQGAAMATTTRSRLGGRTSSASSATTREEGLKRRPQGPGRRPGAPNIRRMRRASLLAFLVGVAVLPALALAEDRFGSRVSIKVHGLAVGSPDDLHGKVKSSREACERGRRVKVLRRHGGTTTVYGRDRTNADGEWRFVPGGAVPNGHYRAVARRKEIAAGICRRARSDEVFVD
jgi:hypothetical protein